MNSPSQPPTAKGALVTTRIIWAALLLGQIVFLIVTLVIRANPAALPANDTAKILAYAAMAMVAAVAPVAFLLRRLIYGQGDARGSIEPQKYVAGNIVFLALFEGASFVGLVAFFFGNPLGLVASAVAIIIQVVSFPTGSVLDSD
jgi:hypothetical protein